MRWLAIAIAAIGVVALLWIGSELHYQGCVNAAEKATPTPRDLLSLATEYRQRRIRGCSRLPF